MIWYIWSNSNINIPPGTYPYSVRVPYNIINIIILRYVCMSIISRSSLVYIVYSATRRLDSL